MTTTSRGRKFTYNIISTQLWERESARALQTIRTAGFLQKLSSTDDVTKYRGIPVVQDHILLHGIYGSVPHFTIFACVGTS